MLDSAMRQPNLPQQTAHLLNFNEVTFLSSLSGALALAPRIDAAVQEALAAGAPNLHFLGAGGAAIVMRPAVQLLRRRSSLPIFDDPVAEHLVSTFPSLARGSIAVIPSQSGTTQESVEMLRLAQARGAKVITLVGNEGTPLGREGDYVMVNPVTDDTSSESFYIQSLLIALSVLRHRGEIDNYESLTSEMLRLPKQLIRMKKAIEPRAAQYASLLADRDYHIVTAAGNAWPEALSFGMCTLEERQWIRARPVPASDFFHGTLELVEPGLSVVLLKGEDEARPLAERVERFVAKIGARLVVLDTADYPTIGLSNELRGMLSPAFLTTLLERICVHLEIVRNHPLSTRRYYRRVDY